MKIAGFYFCLAAALLPEASQAAPAWQGSVGWRYVIQNRDDGLNSSNAQGNTSESVSKSHQVRAELELSEMGEVWDWAVGLRTTSSATSDWTTVRSNLDQNFNLAQAYFRYRGKVAEGDWSVKAGRGKTVILYDQVAQTLFDKDNRWDGFGWEWKRENYGVNFAQYVLGARSQGTVGASTYTHTDATDAVADTQSGFGYLFSLQPHITFQVTDEVEALVAIAYHVWSGTGGNSTAGWYSNTIHGGTAGTAGNTNPIIMDNARQWHIFTDWKLPQGFRFLGEYVQNRETFYGTRGALTGNKAQTGALGLTVTYGKVKEKGDWAASYSYVRKGGASVIGTFSNSNMAPDNLGHLLAASYGVEKGLTVTGKAEFYMEKAKLGGDGVALSPPNQNREQSQSRYELVGSLAF